MVSLSVSIKHEKGLLIKSVYECKQTNSYDECLLTIIPLSSRINHLVTVLMLGIDDKVEDQVFYHFEIKAIPTPSTKRNNPLNVAFEHLHNRKNVSVVVAFISYALGLAQAMQSKIECRITATVKTKNNHHFSQVCYIEIGQN